MNDTSPKKVLAPKGAFCCFVVLVVALGTSAILLNFPTLSAYISNKGSKFCAFSGFYPELFSI